ncbi:hypothetical protein C7H19_01515 [Aphanothece hegewaldii CCALA 016]|uniref:Sulfotransferase domain-containing protein n=1 Tax=Aphanothece hegewaldii CCALA 016 TaxID=2107694 RepID=A0A2T1M3S3_9CHRO|nr:sulfotransferase domain-containing protein [Aphanothece hegewaldii]PSF39493.1 hypothetical protein C7H19_01515 [Aphanothece hegewaldii CCALA 016]
MSELIISSDSQGIFISRSGNTPLYLKDKNGYLTQERVKEVQHFLAVKASEQGYEVLCLLKNNNYVKLIIDASGQKKARQLLNTHSINDLANEFQIDLDFLSLLIPKKSFDVKPERLIVHCSYHQVATNFFANILRGIAKEFGWKFQSCNQDELNPDTKIFMQQHSQVNLTELPPFVGSHIIRDPRYMVISGYFYHLWTSEKWCHKKQKKYDGKSYQEVLNSVSQDEGIKLEMERIKKTFQELINWDYNNPNFIEIRLEDLVKDEQGVFKQIFLKYGFKPDEIEQALKIVDELSIKKNLEQQGEENKNNYFDQGISGDWKNYFTNHHKAVFKQEYPKLLQKLGYEQDDNW